MYFRTNSGFSLLCKETVQLVTGELSFVHFDLQSYLLVYLELQDLSQTCCSKKKKEKKKIKPVYLIFDSSVNSFRVAIHPYSPYYPISFKISQAFI